MSETAYFSEAAYARALEGIAMGAPRGDVLRGICDTYGLSVDDAERVLPNALHDAIEQGIERDDIDPSWFRR